MARGQKLMSRPIPKRHIDGTWFINAAVLLAIALLAFMAYTHLVLLKDRKYIEAGKAACDNRPSFEYFSFCNARFDGPACAHETRPRMMDWYEPVDYACAKAGPDRVFVFEVREPLEGVEIASAS